MDMCQHRRQSPELRHAGFLSEFNQFVVAMESQPASRPEGHIEQAVQAFSPPQIPGEWRNACENIVSQTVQRLRNLLHQGKLKAYYFDEMVARCTTRARGPRLGLMAF